MRSAGSEHPLILCIDDAEIALRVRKLLLASAGYTVLTSASGEEGLEMFKQNPVDLVIADRTPVLEQLASTVADKTARLAGGHRGDSSPGTADCGNQPAAQRPD